MTGDPAFDDYWQAVSVGDTPAATAVAHELLADHPVEVVMARLVVAAQRQVGELWAQRRLSVAREHAITAVNEAVVRGLGRTIPDPDSGPVVLVACVEREWHSLPVRVVTETLRSRGFRAHALGANASPDALISRVVDLGPRAVLLSATLTSSLPRARRLVEAVRGTGTPVVIGGRAFADGGARARRIGATGYAAGPAEVVELLQTLPRHVSAAPALRHPGALEARSVVAAGEQVTRDVVDRLAARLAPLEPDLPPDHWWEVLTAFVPHVVDTLAGAMMVEDPSLVEEVESWLDAVLAHRGAPEDVVAELRAVLAERLVEYPAATALLTTGRR